MPGPIDPFNPKLFFLYWSISVYVNSVAVNNPYVGITAGELIGTQTQGVDARLSRFRLPIDAIVKEMFLFSQFSPAPPVGETWQLFSDNGATLIGSVYRAANQQSSPRTRMGRLVQADNILTMTQQTDVPGFAGGYNIVCTVICEAA